MLSSIAAWYSIIGLTAIFAGAVIPIIIMGSVLELGKVVTTVWLRKYWHRCSWIIKAYLVPAVFLLAFLTSMGIFGFLSKAHTDQNLVSGDVQSKLNIYDEKIKTAKENIEANRKQLKQMDEAVDQVMARSTTEEGATKANNIRRSQQRDRTALAKDIEANQRLIASLNDEAAPIRAEVRKVEAEVGPIKYIAAFIYGDNPDQNLLERAVRWVIIIIVIVFDPLALMLVIAANQSKEWDEEDRELDENTTPLYVADVGEKPTQEELEEINKETSDDPNPPGWMFKDPGEHPKDSLEYEEKIVEETEPQPEVDKFAYLKKPFIHFKGLKPIVGKVEEPVKEISDEVIHTYDDERLVTNHDKKILAAGVDVVDRPGDYLPDDTPNFEGVKGPDGKWVQTGPEFQSKPYQVDNNNYVSYDNRHMPMAVFKELYPELALMEDDTSETTKFGTAFPKPAKQGQVFIRVDTIPNRVYKFNGASWIETNRKLTDTHLTDDYLQFLVDKIASGEYDPDILTANEQDALENFVKKQNS